VVIHSIEQTIFGFTHIEGIMLVAGKEVDQVAGGASGMGVDRINEVGDRASEEQAAGVYGADFTAGYLERVLARHGTREPEISLVLTRN
jgi:hypothetical protein